MNPLKRAAKWLLFSPPRGLRHGRDVVMKHPRRLEGVRYVECGDRVVVCEHSWIAAFDQFGGRSYQPRIRIGNDVTITRHACITATNSIEIGDGCLFSEHVYISDHVHEHDPRAGLLVRQPLHSKGPVRIGRSCFLGYRAVVLPGVELGDHCVVGANSVVTRSFPAYSMLAGAPARLIRRFNHETGAWDLA
jgi:acetyltransferase-like isoleucine patch superfamily enzyme